MPTITYKELAELRVIKKTKDNAYNILLRYSKQLEKALAENNLNIDGSVKNSNNSSTQNITNNISNCENVIAQGEKNRNIKIDVKKIGTLKQ